MLNSTVIITTVVISCTPGSPSVSTTVKVYKIEATPRGPNQPKKSVVTGFTWVPIKLRATGIIRIRVKLIRA